MPLSSRKRRTPAGPVAMAAVATMVTVGLIAPMPDIAAAQGVDLSADRAEQEEVRRRQAEVDQRIDVDRSDAGRLQEELDSLEQRLASERAQLTAAQDAARAAREASDAAERRLVQAQADYDEARDRLEVVALDAYTIPPPESGILSLAVPISEMGVAQAMLGARADEQARVTAEFERLRQEMVRRREEAVQRQQEADAATTSAAEALARLEESQANQQQMLEQLDLRISQRLSESAALAGLDQNLSNRIAAGEAELAAAAARAKAEAEERARQEAAAQAAALAAARTAAEREAAARTAAELQAVRDRARQEAAARAQAEREAAARRAAARPTPTPTPTPAPDEGRGADTPAPRASGGSPAPGTVGWADVRRIPGTSIWVHTSIFDRVQALIDAARAAGIELGGGGYRDPAAQIELRRQHCGTDQYSIYQMPASQCRPPTAQPGMSLHERGLAVDLTYNGTIIGTRSNPAYVWLAANAARFGMYNLPSEPWHWSTTGA